MRFTESEIQMATRLRGAGLLWVPQAGHYVFDIDGMVKAASPFQAGVHLISSPNAMEQLAGGEDDLRDKFAWLPTWEDSRSWLDDHDVAGAAVVEALRAAVDDERTDLEALYGLILDTLERSAEAGA